MLIRGIREFVSRDWRAAREAKDRYWRDRVMSIGPLEGLRVADELRRHAQLQDPGWPHPADRRADLESHLRLAALLHRAGSARRS